MTLADPAGYPAKYRGIYFDGTNDGRVELPSFTLYHSFHLQAWIMNTDGGTIFSRDRNSSFGGDDEKHFKWYINPSSGS